MALPLCYLKNATQNRLHPVNKIFGCHRLLLLFFFHFFQVYLAPFLEVRSLSLEFVVWWYRDVPSTVPSTEESKFRSHCDLPRAHLSLFCTLPFSLGGCKTNYRLKELVFRCKRRKKSRATSVDIYYFVESSQVQCHGG